MTTEILLLYWISVHHFKILVTQSPELADTESYVVPKQMKKLEHLKSIFWCEKNLKSIIFLIEP